MNKEASTITEYMQRPGGGRARSFTVCDVTVLVTPSDDSVDNFARELTDLLEDAANGVAIKVKAPDEANDRITKLERQLAEAITRIPPAMPIKVMRGGCVRFAEPMLVNGKIVKGTLWLLGTREKGWSSWGVRCDGWDDLFRRYNVTITEHGTDEHGLWWTVEPL